MIELADWKLISSALASILYVAAIVPYVRDIYANKTKPHIYTWFIWLITQGTAALALIVGGGKLASIPLLIGVVTVGFVFLLSFKHGSKNITKSDTFSLISALLAILVWWQLDSPLAAVLMVSLVDALGYFPTYRKSFREPWSETSISWLMAAIATLLVIMSISEYNLLTLSYVVVIFTLNASLYFMLLIRRKTIPNPASV